MEAQPDYAELLRQLQESKRALQESERAREADAQRLRPTTLPEFLDVSHAELLRQLQESERARQESERARQESERARQESERARQESERAQQESERARQESERAREADAQRLRPTTLPEFLDVSHAELLRQLQESERARQESERARQESERAREADAQRLRPTTLPEFLDVSHAELLRQLQESERAREADAQRLRPTTLPEFLDFTHTSYYCNLSVRNKDESTQGDPANALQKVRPRMLKSWDRFPDEQNAIWEHLMSSDFVRKRSFMSVNTIEENGRNLRTRPVGSELDVHYFLRLTVEEPVRQVIAAIYDDAALRKKFCLHGPITFENHNNTLAPDVITTDLQSLNPGTGRRRSPRLNTTSRTGEAQVHRPTNVPRPRADQICVYNSGDGNSRAVCIAEIKAPHKLPLHVICDALSDDMDLDDIVRSQENESQARLARRLVAAIITQAFSYMIHAGLQFGCVHTGEALIFLMVEDDPNTVYYFLSAPKHDVGNVTGFSLDSATPNKLHLTAVGQTLAFILHALQAPSYTRAWQLSALDQLPRWEVTFEDVLKDMPEFDASPSVYIPTPTSSRYARMSPVQLRKRTNKTSQSCATISGALIDSDSDSEPDSESPSRRDHGRARPDNHSGPQPQRSHQPSSERRRSRHGRGTTDYCTHECLLGLRNGGALDPRCPNVQSHGSGTHQLSCATFLSLLQQQLADDFLCAPSYEEEAEHCRPLGHPGARGVLFRIRMRTYDYTLVAKGTPSWFSRCLEHEAGIYDRLEKIQGINVPVHLGHIHLRIAYIYQGIAAISHMMLLSFAGSPIHRIAAGAEEVKLAVKQSMELLHQEGVLHGDVASRNILYRNGSAMIIDFDRARILERRTVLGDIANRKRKNETEVKKLDWDLQKMSSELRQALASVKA